MAKENIYDGALQRIENFKVTADFGEFLVKRIETFRPSHITVCDKSDSNIRYEIVQKVNPLHEQEVIKQIEENRDKLKEKDYPDWSR